MSSTPDCQVNLRGGKQRHYEDMAHQRLSSHSFELFGGPARVALHDEPPRLVQLLVGAQCGFLVGGLTQGRVILGRGKGAVGEPGSDAAVVRPQSMLIAVIVEISSLMPN